MKSIIAHYIRHPIWTTVLFMGVILFGLLSMRQLRFSFFPEIQPDTIQVQITYPGASPEEVSESVILKIEENLDGLTGIERITSLSRENTGTVTIEVLKGYDIDKVLSDVKNAVDRINSFPIGAEKPVIFAQNFRTRSLSIVLFGETDLYNLKYMAESLRDELLSLEAISQVTIQGLPDLEFSIEVSESVLRRYRMTFDEIASAVAGANINISGGKFDTKDEEILIRAYGREYEARELADLPVRGNPDGTYVLLKDIAVIRETWEDIPDKIYFNGREAVILAIDQTESEDILAIAEAAKEKIETFNASQQTVSAMVLDDRTIPLKQRLNLLVKNGIIGLFLILGSL